MTERSSKRDQSFILPREVIEETTEHHFWKNTVRSQVLYSSVLFSLVVALAILPFIFVDVTVVSRGIIRPVSEVKILSSPASGRIIKLKMTENEVIPEGTLLAEIESTLLEERLAYKRHRSEEAEKYIRDLNILVKLDSSDVLTGHLALETPVLHSSFIAFRQELQNLAIELNNAGRLYKRKQYLHEKKAISSAELEKSEYGLNSVRSRYQLLFDKQIREWEDALARHRQELDKLKAEELQLQEELKQFRIYMPVTGTLQNLAGISEGSYVQVNQQLAEISPDTALIAECYISPGDVGMLRRGMQVRFQIDAFDYNQWGTTNGEIVDISNDVVMNDGQPFFRVRSAMNDSFLELSNGYRGYLKKGMTLQARFRITERSLFQLLYDNVDDWLNPSVQSSQIVENG